MCFFPDRTPVKNWVRSLAFRTQLGRYAGFGHLHCERLSPKYLSMSHILYSVGVIKMAINFVISHMIGRKIYNNIKRIWGGGVNRKEMASCHISQHTWWGKCSYWVQLHCDTSRKSLREIYPLGFYYLQINAVQVTPMLSQLDWGHSMSDHPMLETVPPQILIKSYTFGLCD